MIVGTRNEFEQYMLNTLYPWKFPELKEDDTNLKCVIGLYIQTGRLLGRYRQLIGEANMTVPQFCRIGSGEMYPPLSSPLHLDAQLPDHCLTWDSYWNIATEDSRLRSFFYSGQGRRKFIKILLDMRRERSVFVWNGTYDLSMYCYSLLVQRYQHKGYSSVTTW